LVHEVISRRSELGHYHRLANELYHDHERFTMSTSQFSKLLGLVGPEYCMQCEYLFWIIVRGIITVMQHQE